MCIILAMSGVSRPLSVVNCEDIFKQLGEMPDTYIIFCYIQELSEFYFLHNKQLSMDST